MIGLLVDNNIEKHGRLLWSQFANADWEEMHVSSLLSLTEAGLSANISDREVWLHCQANELLLLTANRNRRGSTSLQATLEELNHPVSFPVLTLSNSDRVLTDVLYRELCAYRIAEIALELPGFLGAARVFIP